jgi:hypothetical protein
VLTLRVTAVAAGVLLLAVSQYGFVIVHPPGRAVPRELRARFPISSA